MTDDLTLGVPSPSFEGSVGGVDGVGGGQREAGNRLRRRGGRAGAAAAAGGDIHAGRKRVGAGTSNGVGKEGEGVYYIAPVVSIVASVVMLGEFVSQSLTEFSMISYRDLRTNFTHVLVLILLIYLVVISLTYLGRTVHRLSRRPAPGCTPLPIS